MIIAESEYINHIKSTFTNLKIENIQVNQDGMVNVSVIINQKRVFRFPRAEWGIPLLHNEMKVIDLIQEHVDIPTPDWDYRSDEMVSYPYISGTPLLTDDVLRLQENEKDALAGSLATFLKQLHTIPIAEVHAADIQTSKTARSTNDWLKLYTEVEEHLFPLMWADGREWVRRHFAPLLSNHQFMNHDPVFMNGDLATYHILFDQQTKSIKGIIDFGTAGIGDPATDFAMIINQYGESFLKRMSKVYPEIKNHIARARFRAGTLELQWVLQGIKNNMADMFVVHIGRARDMKPIESDW